MIGSVVGVSLLVLLISGLPWTAFWGKHAQTMATDNSTSMWGADPGGVSKKGSTLDESLPHSHVHEIP